MIRSPYSFGCHVVCLVRCHFHSLRAKCQLLELFNMLKNNNTNSFYQFNVFHDLSRFLLFLYGFQGNSGKMASTIRVTKLTNRSPASRSSHFVITRMITDQIRLHSVHLPILIVLFNKRKNIISEVDFLTIKRTPSRLNQCRTYVILFDWPRRV